MVLEALAAVGLAGNIVQFLDFSSKLFSTTASIQRSYAGSSEGLQDVETITLELQRWCVKIPGLLRAPGQQQALQRHRSLLKLAENCETTATDLLAAVQSLKTKKPKSKWSSFKAALATIWKESQINDMVKRLDSYRQQLILELALLQSDDNKDIRSLLGHLEGISLRIGTEITSQIAELRIEIRDALDSLKRDLEETQRTMGNTASQDYGQKATTDSISVAHTVHAANLADCSSRGSDIIASLSVLESLTFEQMRYRHDTIIRAHPKTCEWVYTSKFQSWLKSPDRLFWISGKPGSGKSTMMKNLVNNPNTLITLKEWSSSHNLVLVDYFFWVNGTEIQRSQEGLLRALLFDIFRQNPNLIKDLLPSAWKSATDQHIGGTPTGRSQLSSEWSRESLLEAFQRLSTIEDMKTRFCIFIDGLDEYDGDHEELIDTIRHLTKAGIKLCVASRPWNVFEEAFGSDDATKIYMQHLNTADIQQYVHDKLEKHPKFQQIDQDSAEEIVDEIVEKSQGVFLWVRLVVRSLTEGLRNHDSITLLRKRLDEFPSDLDQFFRYMFLSLETVYRPRLSHLFQVALVSNDLLSPFAYYFLDEVEEKPDLALAMSVQATSKDELSQITDTMVSRINGRSKGLLEVSLNEDPRENKVDFLHRTVKDFIMTTDIQKMVADWQDPQFDPHLTICKVTLAEIKFSAPISLDVIEWRFIKALSQEFLRSAYECETNTNRSPTAYIVGFEKVLTEFLRGFRGSGPNSWYDLFNRLSFLELVASYDLCIFVAETMEKNPPHYDEAVDSLLSILARSLHWDESLSRTMDFDGIPKILDVILSGSPIISTMVDGCLLDAIVDRSYKLDSNRKLSLAKRLIQHSIVFDSILEDAHFKRALSTEIRPYEARKNLVKAYELHRRGNGMNSTSNAQNPRIDQEPEAESKPKQKSTRSSIRRLFRIR